jgi:hypothetical protein
MSGISPDAVKCSKMLIDFAYVFHYSYFNRRDFSQAI